jgi:hypothetical protein
MPITYCIVYATLLILLTCARSCSTRLSESVLALASAAYSAVGTFLSHQDNKPRVLLIDEVDIFLSDEIFGACCNPGAHIQHSAVSKLLQHLYDRRYLTRNDLYYRKAVQSAVYKCWNITSSTVSQLHNALSYALIICLSRRIAA